MGDAFLGGFGQAVNQPYGIFVKVPDIPLWLPDGPRTVLTTLTTSTVKLALMDVAGFISEEAGKFADTGNLAQSFGSYPAGPTGGIEIFGSSHQAGADIYGRVFSSLPYAIVMDQGRRPGAPISRVGIDAIGLWAQRKLGLSAHDADSAKWAIAAQIVAQGIEGKGYFEDGVNRARPRVEQLFKILGDQIAAGLVKTSSSGGQTGTAG